MRGVFFLLFFFSYSCVLFAQKPLIDSSVYGKWPRIASKKISDDGNYAAYSIANKPIGFSTLVIVSMLTKRRMEVQASDFSFAHDGKSLVFIKSGDSLGILALGTFSVEYIANVRSFKLARNGNEEWLVYQFATPDKRLVISKINDMVDSIAIDSIIDYSVAYSSVIMQVEVRKESTLRHALKVFDLANRKIKTVWDGVGLKGMTFNRTKTEFAFEEMNTKGESSLWYYKRDLDTAVKLADEYSRGIHNHFILGDISQFSNDGTKLFFNLKEKERHNPVSDLVKLDVWSYKDPVLQSVQLEELGSHDDCMSIIRLSDHKIIRLALNSNEQMIYDVSSDDKGDSLAIVLDCEGDYLKEWGWNPDARMSVYLVSINDGSRKLVNKDVLAPIARSYTLSPTRKYLVYYDGRLKNYFSYTVSTGAVKNISQGIRGAWVRSDADVPAERYYPIGEAGWLNEDSAIFLYDEHDIFLVDPSVNRPFVNLTNGYGRKSNIVFRFAIPSDIKSISNMGQKIILNALDRNNMDDGFYSITLGRKCDPDRLTMQPYMLDGSLESESAVLLVPVKAQDAEGYLVERQSASEAPNLFYTSDFRTFDRLSDLNPEKQYNWLTSELITWKTLDGTLSKGILYKPENFDASWKYPIIFFYYETFSGTLQQFLVPEASRATINIPFYVSNGYLVFVPDIHYPMNTGQGKGVYNSVVSAAQYLSKFPWVDSKRMGINGHSRGGFETDYLVTHTNIFAAAISGSGYCDAIGTYTSEVQGAYEWGHLRIGATLWQRPDLYIENSPIFRVDKVTTPILMMNNELDGEIPFAQGVEFFTALRRLGKKAWMLQYDGEGHVLLNKKATNDLSIRMKQFFDHYLKGLPAPKWMANGIPAERKGIDLGYELDSATKEP